MSDSIDLGKAFSHLFDDPDWGTKTVLGAALGMVPILNFSLIGYELRMIRNVVKGETRPMPAWDNLGEMFMEGLQLGLARLLLSLPMVLFIIVPLFSFFFVPFFMAALAGSMSEAEAERFVGPLMGGWMLTAMLCCGIGLIISLALGFVFPAMTANFSRRGTFAACFDFHELFGFIRRNPSNYLMVWLASVLAGLLVAVIYSGIAAIPCLGSFLALPVIAAGMFFNYMVSGHALGQALAFDQPESSVMV